MQNQSEKKLKVAAVLPVKGSSSRIANKNLKLMDGKPLFIHTLQKLVECSFIDEVYLDSESEEIHEIASEIPCKKLKRDPRLASNSVDGHELLYNEALLMDADIIVQILCTSPFILKETIQKGINILEENREYDSVVMIRKEKFYFWKDNKPSYNLQKIPNSFTLEDTVFETMGLYIIRKDVALSLKRRIGDHPYLLEATPLEAIDVNYPEDFQLAELIAAGKREKERKFFCNLGSFLTSSRLSDILDEFQIKNKVFSTMKPNLPERKIFGRAKTLKIVARKEQNEGSIYDALKSYETIIPNDIIVVETEVPELAYFGELNANLAMRSGAAGAIVGGNTRDTREVRALGFPVFSSGSTCRDVKNSGVVESMNKTIQISGVEIEYEDLIFGDNDGIVVIPKKFEEKILQRCYELIRKESEILTDIVLGKKCEEILSSHGDF